MGGNEAPNDANVGLKDGGVDVDVKIVQIVNNHFCHSSEFRVIAHHDQRVESVDESQLQGRLNVHFSFKLRLSL